MSGRWQDVPVPKRMQRLATDGIGRPVPWFVAWIGGKPDFRIIAPDVMARALAQRLCWMCGQQLGMFVAFVVGPMCVVNRVSAEPPSHANCAEYAVRVCPFLTHPAARRRETSMPEDTVAPGGVMIRHNPGVSLVWVTREFTVWYPRRNESPLFSMGDPDATYWFAQGRRAYRQEVLESLAFGLPELRRVAMEQGRPAVVELDAAVRVAQHLIPSDHAPLDDLEPPRG